MPRQRPKRGKLRQVRPQGPTLTFEINPQSVTESGDTGGWDRIPRPRRKTALDWRGRSEYRVTFTLLLDAWPDGDVERQVRILQRMGRPRGPRRPPPILELEYGSTAAGRQLVIDDDGLAWGEELRNADLELVRQEVTITLVEYEEAGVALTPADRAKNKGGKGKGGAGGKSGGAGGGGGKGGGGKKGGTSANRTYTVKQGDTLPRIARKTLGDASDWPDIAALNGIRDPANLRVGQRLRIPAG